MYWHVRLAALLMLVLAGCAQVQTPYAPYSAPNSGIIPEHGGGDGGGGGENM